MKLKSLFSFAVLFAFAAILALLPGASKVVAQAPASEGGTVPYSGRLSNDAGQPVADGAYAFSFALYDAAQDGNLLWSETQTEVAVKSGAFNALLGSATPLPMQARISNGWLAVSVRGPDEAVFTVLAPRQLIDATVASAPSSPAAGAACAHTHFGESWSGNSSGTTANAGLMIQDTKNNGAGIYGKADNGNNSAGVLGSSTNGAGVWGNSSNWTGVIGYSTNGVGVFATTGSSSSDALQVIGYNGTSPAIRIDGSIHVSDAGIDSDTPVFIHKVVTGAGGNICPLQTYATVIDNPITNGKPGAILVVTPNYGSNTAGVGPANGVPAVFYDAANTCLKGNNKWVIYSLNEAVQVNNSTFNVMVVLP
jgi:hypothetical protein